MGIIVEPAIQPLVMDLVPADRQTRPQIGPRAGAALPSGPPPAVPAAGRRQLVANAAVVGRADLTPLIARIRIRPDGPIPPFEPGQYFSLGLPIDGSVVLRPYSTASPRGTADSLEFLVRRVPTGAFTPTLWRTSVGDRIWIGPPKGLFKLTPNDPRDHLFVSSGTGIAPFISMLDELFVPRAAGREAERDDTSNGPRVVVAHGVSYASELAYRDRLENAATREPRLTYVPTVSRPGAPENDRWTGRTGRVESILAEMCDQLLLDPSDTVAYLCGNPEMVAASREVLLGRGLPPGAVIHENYWTVPAT